jgi:two-component sensor histidine kinase/CheY-like chemotaxis protein
MNDQLDLKHSTILVIDDNPANLAIAVNFLEEFGFTILVSGTGKSGLMRAKYTCPDLILLDVIMPDVDGFETCRQLKQDEETQDIPIIFMTALSEMENKMMGFELGAVDYITKPIQKEELLARVRVHLQLRALTRTLEEKNQRLTAEVKQRVTTETALQQLNQKLEMLVDQRAAQLRQSNEQLKLSLHEKEVLLKEVHHRVKNNLNVIISLLSLQSKSFNDPKVIEVFENSKNRIYSIALVHEQLYQSQTFSQINFRDYIRQLVSGLFYSCSDSSASIKLTFEIDEIYLNIETAIPCGMIINELVTNAIKYAFPDQRSGEIKIILKIDKLRKFYLTIQDNGIGFPPSFDWKNAPSLGLTLVRLLIKQLDGTIEREHNTVGVSFCLQFRELKLKNISQ